MRADRLLSIMMLLQHRGRMRAEELARELEVSVRTIYRDIDALSFSGVPVYADGGPGGGYSLLDSYRTELTGLSREETEALFLLSIPGPLSGLSAGKKLKSAMRKIASSVSADLEAGEARARERFYLDSVPWFHRGESVNCLDSLHHAVWHSRKVRISYQDKKGRASEREIAPYALVAKGANWYLVADTSKGMRVFRVARIQQLAETGVSFIRREKFCLETFWKQWSGAFIDSLQGFAVELSAAPDALAYLCRIWDDVKDAMQSAPAYNGGRIPFIRHFNDEYEALYQILQLGTIVRVEGPRLFRQKIRNEIANMARLYETEQ